MIQDELSKAVRALDDLDKSWRRYVDTLRELQEEVRQLKSKRQTDSSGWLTTVPDTEGSLSIEGEKEGGLCQN